MYRTVRRRLFRALRPYQPGHPLWQATAVVLLPAHHTAAPPLWSPGPGFVEISTASKWGRRNLDGRLEAVVGSTDRYSDHPVLIRGALSFENMLGFGGITDKPHRLRWMAMPGTLSEQRLTAAHPAMLYQDWFHGLVASAEHRIALSGLIEECCERIDVTRRPDGRLQVVLELAAWSDYFAADLDDISRALTRIAGSYGPGTRLTVYRPTVSAAVTDPLYANAWRRFRDRAADLVASPLS